MEVTMRILLKMMMITIFSFLLTASDQLPVSMEPVLAVKNNPDAKPLVMEKLDIKVKISGFLVETKMTMTFFNPNQGDEEGELLFPMQQDAVVTGYALDINGILVDGVAVEKQRGTMVFEEIVRRAIDPGLLEKVSGNTFKTRVYPFPASGSRTVLVRSLSQLQFNHNKVSFTLPLNWHKRIKNFSLQVEINVINTDTSTAPEIIQSPIKGFRFAQDNNSYRAEAHLKNPLLDRDLTICFPTSPPKIYVEKSADGNCYFAVWGIAAKQEGKTRPPIPKPKRITVFWDTSGSREKKDHTNAYRFLESFFQRYGQRKVLVNLVFFRHKRSKPKHFTIISKNCQTLLKAIKKVDYDGATQLGVISPRPREKQPDFYFLFSDGVSNFRNRIPTGFEAPLYIFSNSGEANAALLDYLAHKNQGHYFRLDQHNTKEILDYFISPDLHFLSATPTSTGMEISEIFPQVPPLNRTSFTLTGKLNREKGKITVNYGRPEKVVKRDSYSILRNNAVEGEMVKVFWANRKIDELSAYSKQNREQLVALGKKYGLVTPYTSLIVLERLEQYVEFRIEPPASLPRMRKEYHERIRRFEAKQDDNKWLKDVIDDREERDRWIEEHSNPAAVETKKIKKTVPKSPEKSFKKKNLESAAKKQPEQVKVKPAKEPKSLKAGLTGRVIYGNIVGKDGSPLPGITVTLTGTNGKLLVTMSNENGWYRLINLSADTYQIKFELEGFKNKLYKNISLQGKNKKIRKDVVLELGVINEQIVVTGAAPTVNAQSSKVSTSSPDGKGGKEALSISIKKWDRKTPYLDKIKKAPLSKQFSVYMQQKKRFGNSPGFYLDCADYFFSNGQEEVGLQILTNIAEFNIESTALLRLLGYRLAQQGLMELSISVFEEILILSPKEPQSYRDLALVLARMKEYKRAIQLLMHIVKNQWGGRHNQFQFQLLALTELNHMIARAKKEGIRSFDIDPRLLKPLEVDIRVMISWDADNMYTDLWVQEPTGEVAKYSHTNTRLGGYFTEFDQRGYGPQEYLLKRAAPGKYILKANYYGGTEYLGPVTFRVDIFTHYGKKNETRRTITRKLMKKNEILVLGEIEF